MTGIISLPLCPYPGYQISFLFKLLLHLLLSNFDTFSHRDAPFYLTHHTDGKRNIFKRKLLKSGKSDYALFLKSDPITPWLDEVLTHFSLWLTVQVKWYAANNRPTSCNMDVLFFLTVPLCTSVWNELIMKSISAKCFWMSNSSCQCSSRCDLLQIMIAHEAIGNFLICVMSQPGWW